VLFQLDDRTQRAQLLVQQAAVAAAKAQVARLAASPRAEDLPIVEAQLAEARVTLADAKRQQALVESLADQRAVSVDEIDHRRSMTQSAEARLHQGEAELAKVKAGAWAPDLAVAQAQLAQAEAMMHATEVEIARLAVTAPSAATVLQVKIRPGEFAAAGVLAQPHVQLGATDTLHVRIDIDENDAWRFNPGSAGECFVRGNLHLHAKLRFVRVEPYVVPKHSLTGDAAERVDTRVLQVIYAFDPAALNAYVGQQVDVYLESTTLPSTASEKAPEKAPGKQP
jgi:multidrug resistance efflux pump